MNKIYAFIALLLLISCEKPGDCIKSAGPVTSKVIEGLAFSKILVNKGISVVIIEGENQKIDIRTGENLINDIEVSVASGMLTLSDNTSCNWTREYGETVVFITTPNLTDIYSKTEKTIFSQGLLTFPNLQLISMDAFDGYVGVGTGDFIMNLNCANLTIGTNTVAGFYLSGNVAQLNVNFYESGGVFHGQQLMANNINVYHRGTNDIILNPLESIRGDIFNTGNVICISHPPTVQVTEHYRGKLIFY